MLCAIYAQLHALKISGNERRHDMLAGGGGGYVTRDAKTTYESLPVHEQLCSPQRKTSRDSAHGWQGQHTKQHMT